ncbi:hypothetical protein N5D61_10310 [Pseudomonas sp. GD03842]|uniref:hypothetical protein n=1 Tax=unclassified Pseudomonas TaxID=196821 RepID=UPI000D3D34BF|nr:MULTISPECIES: hypothetical protein [unclassified Pseudomonas]MDH0746738.1 hypothetical protein [Pseudomonas sp. GD03842]RAU45798.1 hypothetical protein DBP26_012525 [Pseudomonas sp. RIT 409]RAU56103.1 hypothetical protein DBY65_002970 [Pseudomonas sp. RIT 412]
MRMTTDLFFHEPCDDEEDDLATAFCHVENGDLFLLGRFPDEDEVHITFRDDTLYVDSNLTVTLTATQLTVEIDPTDAQPLGGEHLFVIGHGMSAEELVALDATLRILLKDVGTYVSEVG